MSAQKLDGALALMISADPAALFALTCKGGEAPAPSDPPRSIKARAARLPTRKKIAALLARLKQERSQ